MFGYEEREAQKSEAVWSVNFCGIIDEPVVPDRAHETASCAETKYTTSRFIRLMDIEASLLGVMDNTTLMRLRVEFYS